MKKTLIISILILALFHFQLSVLTKPEPAPPEIQQTTKITEIVDANSQIVALSHYTEENPASIAPLLEWSQDFNAVYYEFELLDNIPENLSNEEIYPEHVYFTASVSTNALNIDLQTVAPSYIGKLLYWRVRSIDIDGNPTTPFSKPEPLYTSNNPPTMTSPLPHVKYNEENGTTLLYPVYSYVPIANATHFEIEVTDEPPENPNGIEPSVHRIYAKTVPIGGEHYDPDPRIGTYYWRVRGLDDNGQPIGVYSDAQKYSNEPSDNWQIGIYGDSISHGGGHLSFGPADWAYSYAYYLNFPTINLSYSGDTSATSVERFERDVLPFHPQYLLIMTGTNSLRAGTPAKSVIEDLKTLQYKCRQNNITPILLTLAPINPDNIKKVFNQRTVDYWQESFDEVNAYIRTQPHIDTAAALNSPAVLPTEYAMDGLHGDVKAKKIYAQAINNNISQFFHK